MTTARTARRIGVIVPAHNEQDLIGACVRALAAAAREVAIPVHVAIALDACTDATLTAIRLAATDIVGQAWGDRSPAALPFSRFSVIAVEARGVGGARRAGADFLLATMPAAGTWLATTDADSTVPAAWLRRQIEHRALGADAVVGTVAVLDWAGHPASVVRTYLERYHPVDGHRHIHGANLSLSAEAYLAAGGFPAATHDEDVALVDAVVAAGFHVTWAADLPVTTSARRVGRAPKGFAVYLSHLGDLGVPGHREARRPRWSPLERPGAEAVAQ